MPQVTAKTVEQALEWIDSNGHHEAGLHWAKGRSKETGLFEMGEETHVFYKGHDGKLLVPMALRKQMGNLLEPNERPFDTRMYRLTRAGRRRLNRANKPA